MIAVVWVHGHFSLLSSQQPTEVGFREVARVVLFAFALVDDEFEVVVFEMTDHLKHLGSRRSRCPMKTFGVVILRTVVGHPDPTDQLASIGLVFVGFVETDLVDLLIHQDYFVDLIESSLVCQNKRLSSRRIGTVGVARHLRRVGIWKTIEIRLEIETANHCHLAVAVTWNPRPLALQAQGTLGMPQVCRQYLRN